MKIIKIISCISVVVFIVINCLLVVNLESGNIDKLSSLFKINISRATEHADYSDHRYEVTSTRTLAWVAEAGVSASGSYSNTKQESWKSCKSASSGYCSSQYVRYEDAD